MTIDVPFGWFTFAFHLACSRPAIDDNSDGLKKLDKFVKRRTTNWTTNHASLGMHDNYYKINKLKNTECLHTANTSSEYSNGQ